MIKEGWKGRQERRRRDGQRQDKEDREQDGTGIILRKAGILRKIDTAIIVEKVQDIRE